MLCVPFMVHLSLLKTLVHRSLKLLSHGNRCRLVNKVSFEDTGVGPLKRLHRHPPSLHGALEALTSSSLHSTYSTCTSLQSHLCCPTACPSCVYLRSLCLLLFPPRLDCVNPSLIHPQPPVLVSYILTAAFPRHSPTIQQPPTLFTSLFPRRPG